MILGLMADHTFCKDPASTACTTHDGKTGTCRSGICTVGLQECSVVRTVYASPLSLLPLSAPAVQSRLESTGLNIHICMELQEACNPATNCPAPCGRCKTSTNTCEITGFADTCTTSDGKAGHCEGSTCKARRAGLYLLDGVVEGPVVAGGEK